MSHSCQASSPLVLPSATVSGKDLGVPLKATPHHRGSHAKANHRVTLPAFERARYFAVKPLVDRMITAALMIVALPVMLLVALAIVLLDGRPVFYRQTRVGKNGRIFRIWKFRTMCRDAEKRTGAVWSSEIDPRVTPLGRWLRCSHLDELPQFFNVLWGDMNLIGPRPERPEFVRELVLELPRYAERLAVRPGITGLAQLRFGYDQSLTDVRRKSLLDSRYIRTASLSLDMRILLFTIPHVVRQVMRKWIRGSQSDARQVDRSPVSRPVPNSALPAPRLVDKSGHQVRPHLALLPDTSAGFCPGSIGSQPGSSTFHVTNTLGTMDEGV